MGDLSKDLSTYEVECHGENCCGHTAAVDRLLVRAFQKLRDLMGCRLDPSCAFRCSTWNKVPADQGGPGSNDTSQHPLGFAMDITTPAGCAPDRMAALAETIPEIKGIGIYWWGIHIDVRLGPPARWRG